ncbi:hypothetical protein SYK_27370 [Pseudodesulfovibrio nedwellii]|uniref:Uncharacterized protein n=1 Tax=Pseudodesulfovibrio nedwellii TaxID=2973072 RepID=A0ABM8B3I6_9BACT|nr:hypothetical protein SYK_27370 [Pseudodesulfovibrio nedwellii]
MTPRHKEVPFVDRGMSHVVFKASFQRIMGDAAFAGTKAPGRGSSTGIVVGDSSGEKDPIQSLRVCP